MKTIRVLGTLLTLVAAACSQTGSDRVQRIVSALGEKHFAEALELLKPALKDSPDNAQLWAMQGTAYDGEGQRADALSSFRHALKIAPDYLPALRGAAQIEYDAGDADGIPILQRVLHLQPGDMTSHAMLAVLEYQQGHCDKAVVHFEKARALFDSKLEGLHAYAACLVKLKHYEQAEGVFQRALALNPDQRRERQLLASVQLLADQPADAIVTLDALLKADSPEPETLALAATAYEDVHDTARAVATLRQAILLDPHNVNLYLDFANISSVHQSFQVGVDVVNDGIALMPAAAPLYFARGVLYTQLGRYDESEADFENAYKLDPSQSLTAAAQGLAAVQANDPDRALASVQMKVKARPDDPLLLYVQADILTQKGVDPGTPDFQLAMQSAKRAVFLRPALAPARAVLAKLYLQSRQYSQAAEQSRKALALDPKDQASVYHLIQALRKTGKSDEIPALLKRLAALREQTVKEERERYRYKLVEEDTPSKQQ